MIGTSAARDVRQRTYSDIAACSLCRFPCLQVIPSSAHPPRFLRNALSPRALPSVQYFSSFASWTSLSRSRLGPLTPFARWRFDREDRRGLRRRRDVVSFVSSYESPRSVRTPFSSINRRSSQLDQETLAPPRCGRYCAAQHHETLGTICSAARRSPEARQLQADHPRHPATVKARRRPRQKGCRGDRACHRERTRGRRSQRSVRFEPLRIGVVVKHPGIGGLGDLNETRFQISDVSLVQRTVLCTEHNHGRPEVFVLHVLVDPGPNFVSLPDISIGADCSSSSPTRHTPPFTELTTRANRRDTAPLTQRRPGLSSSNAQ